MGCDIHAYKEIKVAGKWHCAGPANIGRRYGVFGIMTAGQVRCDDDGLGFTPKGLPDDVSDPVRASSDEWDSDGHTHSYLTSAELVRLAAKFDEWNKIPADPKSERFKEPDDWYLKEFGLLDRHVGLIEWSRGQYRDSSRWIEDARLVFWFDN